MEVYHEFLTSLTAKDIDNICLHSGPNSMRVELFENPVTVVEMEGMPKLHYELVGVHTEEVEGKEVEEKDYIIHALDTDFLRWTAKQVIDKTRVAKWYLVKDAASWQEAYDNGPLRKYYEDHPEEDLWNVAENRAVNFNDRHYVGTIDDVEVESMAKWVSDDVQSIVIDDVTYFMEIFFDMNPRECPLFTDAALTESADKTLVITKVEYSEDCIHCWEGSINAPGAKYPWAVIDLSTPFNGVIEFKHEGQVVYPWGEEAKSFEKGYAIASIPVELGIEPLPAEEAANFEKSDLVIKLIPA